MGLTFPFLSALALSTIPAAASAAVTPQALDAHVRRAMATTGAEGIAVAVINDGLEEASNDFVSEFKRGF